MASGSPSSRRQISATAAAFPLVSSKPADAACARCTNRRTEAYRCTSAASPPAPVGGTGSGGTGNSCSPLSRNTIRLVTSATTPGAAPSSSATSGAAPITCSKLSSTSTSRRARRYDFRSVISAPPEVLSPSAAAIAAVTSSAALTEPSSTNRTPSAKPAPSRCATSTASRLFPTPPGPVRVTRRTPSRHAPGRQPPQSPASRPTSGVAGTGSAPTSGASSRGAVARLRHLEALAQQHRQVVLDEALQLSGFGEALVGDVTVALDPGEHLLQPRLALRRRRLDVDKPGQSRRQEVLVLQPGHLLPRRDPAVALPVHADEDLALRQVRTVNLPRRMRPGTQLEHHRHQPQTDHRVPHCRRVLRPVPAAWN